MRALRLKHHKIALWLLQQALDIHSVQVRVLVRISTPLFFLAIPLI